MKIDHRLISPETLHDVVASFVEREGTDYGTEYSLDHKIRQVMQQLDKGTAVLTYDTETETINIMSLDEYALSEKE